MNVLATYSGAKYHRTTQRIVEDAQRFGVDKVMVYDNHWLRACRPAFVEKMKWFLEHPKTRGDGWFLWKPMVVLDAFRRLNDGDVLLFTDADTFAVADLTPLYDTCRANGGVMLFGARGIINKFYVKRDAFVLMGCDEPKYHDALHTVARFMLFEKGGAFPVEKFLGEWLGFTANPMINTFDPSVILPDYPTLIEPRAEQAVLSLLSIKYGVPLHREACEFGGPWPGETQPNELPIAHQYFSQIGGHSFAPGYARDESVGSLYRNMND
jgi:hypothetical protein